MRKIITLLGIALLAFGVMSCTGEDQPSGQGEGPFGKPGGGPGAASVSGFSGDGGAGGGSGSGTSTTSSASAAKFVVACPTEAGKYMEIDAFKPAEGVAFSPTAFVMPPPVSHVGGRIRAIAVYEGLKIWSMGSSIFVEGNETIDTGSVINSIAVSKISDGRVLVAVGARDGLKWYYLDPQSKSLSKAGEMKLMVGVNSVAIASSTDYNKLVPVKPDPTVDVSINAAEGGGTVESYGPSQSDYIYMAIASGELFRIYPSAIGCGCVENVWQPPKKTGTSLIKVVAQGDYVGFLAETSGSLPEEAVFFDVDVERVGGANDDLEFIFKQLLHPGSVIRDAHLVDFTRKSVSLLETGIISDIAMTDTNVYVASPGSKWGQVGDVGSALTGMFAIITAVVGDVLPEWIKPGVSVYPLHGNTAETKISPNAVWNKLYADKTSAYLWGGKKSYLNLIDLNAKIPVVGKGLDSPPVSFVYDAVANQLTGVFPMYRTAIFSTGGGSNLNGLTPIQLSDDGRMVVSMEMSAQNSVKKKIGYLSAQKVTMVPGLESGFYDDVFISTSGDMDGVVIQGEYPKFSYLEKNQLKASVVKTISGRVVDLLVVDNAFFVLRGDFVDGTLKFFISKYAPSGSDFFKVCESAGFSGTSGQFAGVVGTEFATILDSKIVLTRIKNNNQCATVGPVPLVDSTETIIVAEKASDNSLLVLTGAGELKLLLNANSPLLDELSLKISPQSAKIVSPNGGTAYILVVGKDYTRKLVKIGISADKKIAMQYLFPTDFMDIAVSDKGGLIAATIDNGVEFYE